MIYHTQLSGYSLNYFKYRHKYKIVVTIDTRRLFIKSVTEKIDNSTEKAPNNIEPI